MPHIISFDVKPQPIDELTGTSDSFFGDELHVQADALNETTNVRPSKGESINIVHPAFKTGYDTDSIDSLSETFGDRGLSPISGNGVFKPQDIDTKGSVIWGDNHFTPDRGGDSLTENGGFDQVRRSDLEGQAFVREQRSAVRSDGDNEAWDCNCVPALDFDPNDAQLGMRQNISGTAGPGGSTFMTETFEPAAGMNSFGESLNPVLELGGTAGPGGTSFMTGQFEMPTNKIGGSAGPGGDEI